MVATAIAIADAGGLDAASMRVVADRLGVTPMALYNHIDDRATLIDAMLDRVLAELAAPGTDGEAAHAELEATAPDGMAPWQGAVRRRVMAARDILASHAWAREAIETRERATPHVLAHMDALMAAMFDGGLSADLVHHAMHALSTRMWGFTRDVLPTPAPPSDPAERAAAMAVFAASYPAIVRMATTAPHAGDACDDDAEFAFALDLVLDGIRRLHDAGWRSPAIGPSAPS